MLMLLLLWNSLIKFLKKVLNDFFMSVFALFIQGSIGSPVPVAITEAVLKGVMYTDEPCAPLPYLFSPKFLQTDRARISVHVATKCIPHMKVNFMIYVFSVLYFICVIFCYS